MNRDPIHSESVEDLTIEIFVDDDPESPREWDNLGKMVCWHRRLLLGDRHDFAKPEDFLEEARRENWEILPLFVYEHGGVAMSTSNDQYPFNDHWDAGQVGWIYCEPKKGREEFGRRWRARARKRMVGEVETYNQYLHGEIYGYEISRKAECDRCRHEAVEHIESCWGFYGLDYAKEEALEIAKYILEKEQESPPPIGAPGIRQVKRRKSCQNPSTSKVQNN